jgi:hypothetical protein
VNIQSNSISSVIILYDVHDYNRTYTDLVKRYEISTSQMTTDWFILSYSQSGPFFACNMSSTMGSTSGAGTAYLSGPHEFTSRFKWCSCCTIVGFCVAAFCKSLFVSLSLLFWPLSNFLLCMASDYPFGIFKHFIQSNSIACVIMFLWYTYMYRQLGLKK